MFGFRIGKNFHYPYLSDGVTDFWRRWHISLGAWFRDYVYIPMGGNRCSREKQFRNLAVVWIMTGLWHGNTLNFLFWGIYHGFFVILEKFAIGQKRLSIPKWARILLTDLIAFVGWIFFSHLPSERRSGISDRCSICCGPLLTKLHDALVYRGGKNMIYASVVLHVVLLIFCVANMVGATYSTFLYFRF